MRVRKRVLLAIMTFFLGSIGSAHAAINSAAPVHILSVENGWYGEGVAIWTDTPVPGCAPTQPIEFAVPATHQGYKEVVAMILMAYSQHLPVYLTFDQGNCQMGRTAILSVRLLN